MDMDEILRIEGLSKCYRSGKKAVHANDHVTLQIKAGQVVGLLGHNGAGKTTLVNQVVGLAKPDSGQITLAGINAITHPHQARRLASVQAQANVPITGLTPRRAIELVAQIRGASRTQARKDTAHLIEALDLGPWEKVAAEKVSGGVARLTAFAMATVVPGRLVVLDEPTNDVDPVRRRLLWEEIRRVADAGSGVLLVTHNVREAESVVDRVTILHHGRVLVDSTPSELTSTHETLEDVYITLVGTDTTELEYAS
jgi:ABC-2 type transport system ATP-binding protein